MRIKYDLQSIKCTKILAVITLIMFITGIVLSIFDPFTNLEANDFIIIIIVICIEGGGFLSLLCWISYFMGTCYIKRLIAYGYEIPYRKKDYNNNLNNLPITEASQGKSIGSKYSRIFMFISIFIYILFLSLDIYYYAKWYFMKDSATALFILLMIFHLFWPIFALILKKQSNKDKYRDDVEKDYTKKPRICLETLILTIIIMSCLSLFATSTAHSMTKYVYKSQQMNKIH